MNEKEESRIRSDEGENGISLQKSDDENTRLVSVLQTVPTLPVSTAPNKRSVKEKVTKKASADEQLQLSSVPIGLGQKQVSSEIPHRQSTTVSIPPATSIHAIFTSIRLLLRLLNFINLSADPSGNVAEVRGLNLGTELIPRVSSMVFLSKTK